MTEANDPNINDYVNITLTCESKITINIYDIL